MIVSSSDISIRNATSILKNGGVVAFPTETVYGLGADAANPEAVKRIFQMKERPADHPLIVHLANLSALDKWAINIPTLAYRLAERFWPGPLTLILHKALDVPYEVTGGQETVGIRIPNHPVAMKLIEAFGGGLAAPSANLFGRLSPTRADHVQNQLGGLVDMVLDGGACLVGLESTIINLTSDTPQILRPGGVSLSELSEVLKRDINVDSGNDHLRVPGSLEGHYSPLTPLQIMSFAEMSEFLCKEKRDMIRAGFLLYSDGLINKAKESNLEYRSISRDYDVYSRCLYDLLHSLDSLNLERIFVEKPPADLEWMAVTDRLKRASRAARESNRGPTN